MSTLQSNAKKYSGAAIDYVLLFDWVTGSIIGKAIPNSAGVWSFDYFTDLLCGITYVADGCEPITHGPYSFIAKTTFIASGYLLLSYSSSGGRYVSGYDKNATTEPTWSEYFEEVMDIGLLDYVHGSGAQSTEEKTKVIEMFDPVWTLLLYGRNGSWNSDSHSWTLELLDAQDNVIAAIKSATDGSYRSGLWYGSSLNALTKTGQSGSYPSTSGELSFNDNGMHYISKSQSNFNSSFTFLCDITKVVAIRVSGQSRSTKTDGGGAGGYIRVLPPNPVQ